MSYSFYEVVPFLFYKERGNLYFHYEVMKDLVGEEATRQLHDSFNELLQDTYTGATIQFHIPEFTSITDTDDEICFEAKTFTIKVGKFKKELDESGEGYHCISEDITLIDLNSSEVMSIVASYYVAIDKELTDLECSLYEEEGDDEKQELISILTGISKETQELSDYSFHEVVPFLFYSAEDGEVHFHSESMSDIAGSDASYELSEAFEDITQKYMLGESVEFNIPEFTSITEDGKEICFGAKTFTMKVKNIQKTLEDTGYCSHSFSYHVELTDVDKKENFTYYARYEVGMYHELKEVICEIEENKDIKTVFALILKTDPTPILCGIFYSLGEAIEGYEKYKKQHVCDYKLVRIEEVPMNIPLMHNLGNLHSSFNGCVAIYDSVGDAIVKD